MRRLDFTWQSATDFADILAKLDALIASSQPAGAELLTGLHRALANNERGNGRPEDIIVSMTRYLDHLRAKHADDFAVQVELVQKYNDLVVMADSLEVDPSPSQREALEHVERLVVRFPSQALAHGHLAASPWREISPELALRHWRQCLVLDPSQAWCRDAYNREATDFMRPYCPPDQFLPVSVYSAHEGPPAGPWTIRWHGSELVIDKDLGRVSIKGMYYGHHIGLPNSPKLVLQFGDLKNGVGSAGTSRPDYMVMITSNGLLGVARWGDLERRNLSDPHGSEMNLGFDRGKLSIVCPRSQTRKMHSGFPRRL